MTRTESKTSEITRAGAHAVLCDVFDTTRLFRAIEDFRPDVVWHLLTDLPDDYSLLGRYGPANNRIRREGTANLLKATDLVEAKMIAQSVAWQLPGDGGYAVAYLENAVQEAEGVVIRYGQLYGPGTYYELDPPGHPRIHVADAPSLSLQALEMETGMLTVKED